MPVDKELETRLAKFREEHKISTKGALALVLVLSRQAIEKGLPLDSSSMMTKGGGQIAGSGRAAVQRVLRDHGIERVLAKEGSRTNRGAPKLMKSYVALLNELHGEGFEDFTRIEKWWIARVKDFFAAKGFKFTLDAGASVQEAWEKLFSAAEKAQSELSGDTTLGAMLQHLVGAKLQMMLAPRPVAHHGYSVADGPTGRNADFEVEDVRVHVTTAPSEALVEKCGENLQSNLRPVVITLSVSGVQTIRQLAKQRGLAGRIDCIEAAQFLTTNVYEWSLVKAGDRRNVVGALIACYNEIVAAHETNPRLKIDFV